jgi:TrmH family RNA methyltransferase
MSKDAMITSRKNKTVIDITKLLQRKHRQRQQRFVVQGLDIIVTALNKNLIPINALYCYEQFSDDNPEGILERLHNAGADLIEVNDHVMNALSWRDDPDGILATFHLYDTSIGTLSSKLANQKGFIFILDHLQDPGNLGTLIRTADAIGAEAMILIEPSVDPFDPKTLAASAGSLFNVPIARTADIPELFQTISSEVSIIGTHAQKGTIVWESDQLSGPTALVLGNEAQGISAQTVNFINEWVHLPMLGNTESLNVAVAGGTLAYFWLMAQNT